MEIRKARLEELDTLMALYDGARRYMRANGNMDQWINGYPCREMIREDIENGNSYVFAENGEIFGVFCFFYGEDVEPTYRVIDGAWIKDGPYGVVHRIASGGRMRRMVSQCAAWCLAQCPSLRIDTYRLNRPMRQALERDGFRYCGKIIIEDGSERVAYQKLAGA